MWEAITTTITNIISLLGQVMTSLLNNELFQITIGIVILGIIIGIVFKIVKQLYYGGIEGQDYITSKQIKKFQKNYYKKYNKKISYEKAEDILISRMYN